MATTNNFIVNDDLGYTYNTPLDRVDDLDVLLDALSELLDDMPEPVWLWLDERGDDNLNGPGAWECEIQNEQTTYFAFNFGAASTEAILELLHGCAETIRDHRLLVADDNASFRLGFHAYYVTARNSLDDYLRVTFRVFWEVSN